MRPIARNASTSARAPSTCLRVTRTVPGTPAVPVPGLDVDVDLDVHTLLRLPTGIFYAAGVEANVLFFDKRPAAEQPWTSRLWVYDFRTDQRFTLEQNQLRREHLQDFVDRYLPGEARDERVESERFHAFTYDELVARDKANLDITWLRDASLEDLDDLPAPEVIAREIVEDLTAALAEFEAVAAALEASAAR